MKFFICFLFFFNLSFLPLAESIQEKSKDSLFSSFTFDEKGNLEEVESRDKSENDKEKKESAIKSYESKLKTNKESKASFLSRGLDSGGKKFFMNQSFFRMILSLCLIAGLGSLFLILAHFWRKKFQTTLDHKKMRIMTQFYLGSKKKLIILRVAGEYLLLGVTDSNISLIKTLSLLDEDTSLEPEENFSENLLKLQNKNRMPLKTQRQSSIQDKDFLDDLTEDVKEEEAEKGTEGEREFQTKKSLSKKVESLEDIRSLLERRLRNKNKIS